MIKGAKVLRNAQIVDRSAPHDFLSDFRRNQTRELLDAVIGSMEPERGYIINLHQDEQVDSSHVMITNTLSFEPIVRCRDCKYLDDREAERWDSTLAEIYGEPPMYCESPQWDGPYLHRPVKPDGFCSWGERRDA